MTVVLTGRKNAWRGVPGDERLRGGLPRAIGAKSHDAMGGAIQKST